MNEVREKSLELINLLIAQYENYDNVEALKAAEKIKELITALK